MSRQPQSLQGEVSTKKQIASIIIITGLVFGVWWSLTGIIDLVTGGSRGGFLAEEDLSDVDGGTYGLYAIPQPPFPDIDWESLIQNLSPEELLQLMELLGGNLDTIDPSMLAGFLGSDPEALNTVMFRVFEYPDVADVQGGLFRYSVYDSFSDSDWSKTFPGAVPDTYEGGPPPTDVTPVYRIRIPLGTINPNEEYTITVPSVSPETSIQSGSVQPQNPGSLQWDSVQTPHVDNFGVMYLKPIFNSLGSQNISVRSWGFERDGGDLFYNTTTRANPAIIGSSIRSQYLTFPGGVSANQYRSSRPAFDAVTVDIQNRFNSNPSANLYVKANIIRNYIQESFSVDPFTASTADDIVEDTCQTQIGDYYAIASTYIMLARYFQIPARFVTGYSGHLASESVDPVGSEDYAWSANVVEMKLLNMYAWAETFMPVQDDGTGDWVPMDVLQVSFGDGYSGGYPIGSPPPPGTEMRMWVNGTEFDPMAPMYSVDRPVTVNITVNVTMTGTAYDGQVTLYDMLEEQTLGIITATSGWAEFLWNVDTTVLAGGHAIRGSAGALMNFTAVGVRGALNLNFVDRIPSTIDRTSPNQDLRVIGYLEDIAYTGNRSNNHIPKANISVGLYTNPGMNPITDPFTPGTIKTNETGDFATNITSNLSVLNGTYFVRLNFPGMFTFNLPQIGQASAVVSGMSAISVTRTLEIKDPTQVVFRLYVAGNDYTTHVTPLNPGQTVYLNACVIIGGAPQVGTNVDFNYKDARDGTDFIANVATNGSGWANFAWTVPFTIATGPVVIEAHFWDTINFQNRYDDVYGVVNRSIDLGYSSTPSPADPVYVDSTYVGFIALLNDSATIPVGRAVIEAVILDSFGSPAGFYFTPSQFFMTSSLGQVPVSERITGTDVFTTYYADLWFNQTFNFNIDWFYNTHQYNPGQIQVAWFKSDNAWGVPINIVDTSSNNLLLWINGTPTNLGGYFDGNPPRSYIKGQTVELLVKALIGSTPQVGQTIQFYDDSTGILLGSNTTVSGGWASIKYTINPTTFSGPHLLRVNWASGGKENYTVAFVTGPTVRLESVSVNPTTIIRGQTSISISGLLHDANSRGIFKGRVSLVLLTSTGGYLGSGYFTNGPTTLITGTSGDFAFNVMLSTSLHYGNYQIRVDFNQTIVATDFSACPTYLTSSSGFLVSNSSQVTAISVRASVQFSLSYYTPATPEAGQNITVTGRILWDNGTALNTSPYKSWINVTVWETGVPSNILAMRNLQTDGGSMDGNGYLSIQIKVTWLESFSVRWEFNSQDSFVPSTSQMASGI